MNKANIGKGNNERMETLKNKGEKFLAGVEAQAEERIAKCWWVR